MSEYTEIMEKIALVKGSLNKKEYLELQNMLLNAYMRERNKELSMKTQILNSLNKKISKHLSNIENNEKGSYSKKYMRPNKYYQTYIQKRRTMKKLSPIIEENHNQTRTKSKSRGGKNTRKRNH